MGSRGLEGTRGLAGTEHTGDPRLCGAWGVLSLLQGTEFSHQMPVWQIFQGKNIQRRKVSSGPVSEWHDG